MSAGDKLERLLEESSLEFTEFVKELQGLSDGEFEQLLATKSQPRRRGRQWWVAGGIVVFCIVGAFWLGSHQKALVEPLCNQYAPCPEVTPPPATPTATLSPTPISPPLSSIPETEPVSSQVCVRYAGSEGGPGNESGISLVLNGQGVNLGEGGCTESVSMELRPGDQIQARIILPSGWQVAGIGAGWQSVPDDEREATWQYQSGQNPPLQAFEVVGPRQFSGTVRLGGSDSPIPGAQVTLLGRPEEEYAWRPLAVTDSGPDGLFSLMHTIAEAWQYRIQVHLPDGYVGAVTPVAPEGWMTAGITEVGQVLQSNAVIEGTEPMAVESLGFEVSLDYVQLDVSQASYQAVYEDARSSDPQKKETVLYRVITLTESISDTQLAEWSVALPAGKYAIQTWTPPGARDTYAIEVESAGQAQRREFTQAQPDETKWQGLEAGVEGKTLELEPAASEVFTFRLSLEQDDGDEQFRIGPLRVVPVE